MSDIDDYVEPLTECIPWALVAEFAVLEEILAMRLVSSTMAECMSNLSPFTCASLLQEKAVASELSFVSQTWKKPFQDYVSWLSNGSSLDTLLRILRVIQALPKEMAVAYSGKFGRHAIPLHWNEEMKSLEAVSFSDCRRKNCRTCRMRIPHDSRANAAVYQYINVRFKKHRFDLTKFYPKCMPNLPSNLRCPLCRSNKERTLVLSMLSYQSSGVTNNTPLTFTPHNNDDFSEAEGESSEQEDGNDEADGNSNNGIGSDEETRRGRKRQRVEDTPHDLPEEFAYPPTFDDVMLPHRNEQIQSKRNAKFAISIHCTSCQNFGVAAPAIPCNHEAFSCFHQVEPLEFGSSNTGMPGRSTVGGILVRSKCSNPRCSGATMCRSCCRRAKHRPYATDLNPEEPVKSKCWCKRCNPSGDGGIYCNDCAWITTVCHHM